ncbi:MFS transporter [Corynebacterium hindlerae]|uniref:MFS transporter n=1 Tax=Corynebacterium hindlerae TaxID=699041 RepID=A0A7G5FE45_9CORY|nr:MFS transporter [Corynebacterium hindlerae]QMV84886.1 MFS transporter [Corynebacterium hindlerae]
MSHVFDLRTYRIRALSTLIIAQIAGAVGMGAATSVGALVAADIGGDGWTGMSATLNTVGAALFSIPLASLVLRFGRAASMSVGLIVATVGAALAILAIQLHSFPIMLLGFVLLGAATATNLQARFAAADVAHPDTKSRNLSIVIWATTLGAVLGPNLIAPGGRVAAAVGLNEFAGPFLFSIAAQLVGVVVLFFGLRPDPAVVIPERHETTPETGSPKRTNGIPTGALIGMLAIAVSHLTMVGIMAVTPLHLSHHGASLVIIGLTISLHIAGMFGLSPVFGIAADKVGKLVVIWLGFLILVASAGALVLLPESHTVVTVALVGVGLGWSASLVAGSGLVAESAETRTEATRVQGASDLTMNIAGAVGGAAAGPMLLFTGMPGVAAIAIVLLAVTSGAILWLGKQAPIH